MDFWWIILRFIIHNFVVKRSFYLFCLSPSLRIFSVSEYQLFRGAYTSRLPFSQLFVCIFFYLISSFLTLFAKKIITSLDCLMNFFFLIFFSFETSFVFSRFFFVFSGAKKNRGTHSRGDRDSQEWWCVFYIFFTSDHNSEGDEEMKKSGCNISVGLHLSGNFGTSGYRRNEGDKVAIFVSKIIQIQSK